MLTYHVKTVTLCVSPLRQYKDFCWYDPPIDSMPEAFALVVCDEPPGSTRGGRYGLAAIKRERLKDGCIVLLDDAASEDEQRIARA